MDNKIEKIKLGVYKVALTSIIIFLVSLVLTGVFITVLLLESIKEKQTWMWLGLAVLTGLISIFTLFSMTGGLVFLKANKDWKEIQKVQKKSALDWGLFYFVYASKIDKFSDQESKEIKN
ncbi:hypothetical protein [Spiroplasma endosymbiont of Diplazon laetatorius]|uniref:hypothetical protein n=1 Tax=Spiroplasma endosymbiont of Diplazon laetatorius TaxID=3066322 RepID=UPI0030D0F581